MKMTEQNLNTFRKDIQSLGEKYGMDLKVGRISYHESGFKTTIEGLNLDAFGNKAIDPIQESKAVFAVGRQLGYNAVSNAGVINHRFMLKNGKMVVITGYDSRSHKYPVQGFDGVNNIKFPVSMIKERCHGDV